MRRLLVLALLAAFSTGARAEGRRESAADVASALAGLAARGPRATPRAEGPRRIYVVVPALTADRRRALEAAGMLIEVPADGRPAPRWRDGVVVQGVATAAVERAVRALPFVLRIDTPGARWANVGSVTTAGDAILHTDAARAVLGTDGAGVTVGVISVGLDHLAASVASGDLPSDVTVPPIPGVGAGQGDEGTAILEIVHDLAPGAHLLFASPDTSAEMVATIEALGSAGAKVIVDDLVFTDEPKFEDGPVADAARAFVAGGGLYVTAAGNFATSHYFATYDPGGGQTFGTTTYHAVHRFAAGDFGDSLRIPPGGDVLAVLQWNDAFGRAADDFDLVLAQDVTNTVLAASTDPQAGHGNPFEAVRYVNQSGAPLDVYLAIPERARVTPAANLRLNLVVFSAVALAAQYPVAREAIFGHAAVEEVLSVAAADAATPGAVEPFSSAGPASIFFPASAVRQVPRLTAVDGVATAVGERGQFAASFHGTSAAAPHVAGCAALLVAAGAATRTASAAMQATAADLAPPGFDARSGAGLLDCGAAARVASGQVSPPVVDAVSARFDATAAVVVDVDGEDADADAQSLAVRFLDASGAEMASTSAGVTASGAAFRATVATRSAALATARAVGVRATEALHLRSAETAVAVACPGDGSVGDVFCALGDLLNGLAVVPGRRGRAIMRAGHSAATALVRAGAMTASPRPRRARGPLGVANGRLNAVRRLARAAAVPDALKESLIGDADALRVRIRVLRAAL